MVRQNDGSFSADCSVESSEEVTQAFSGKGRIVSQLPVDRNDTEACCQNVWLGLRISSRAERNGVLTTVKPRVVSEEKQGQADSLLLHSVLQQCRKSGSTVGCDEVLCLSTLLWRRDGAAHTHGLLQPVLEVCVKLVDDLEKSGEREEGPSEERERQSGECRCCRRCVCCRTRQATALTAAAAKLCLHPGPPSLPLVLRVFAAASRLVIEAARCRQQFACNKGREAAAPSPRCCCWGFSSPPPPPGDCAWLSLRLLCAASLELLAEALRNCDRLLHWRHFAALLCGKPSEKSHLADAEAAYAESHQDEAEPRASCLELLLGVLGIVSAEGRCSWMAPPVEIEQTLSPCLLRMHALSVACLGGAAGAGVSASLKALALKTFLRWAVEANAPSLLSLVVDSASTLDDFAKRTLVREEQQGALREEEGGGACEKFRGSLLKKPSPQTAAQMWLASLENIANCQRGAWLRLRRETRSVFERGSPSLKLQKQERRLRLSRFALDCLSGVGLLYALPALTRALLLEVFELAATDSAVAGTPLERGEASNGQSLNCDAETNAEVCAADAFLIILRAAHPLLDLPLCIFATPHALSGRESAHGWLLEFENLRWTGLVAAWHRSVNVCREGASL